MDSNSPIGVFDSGLGGLTVLKELRRLLPHENFIFVGDSARAPYGSRTPEEIISFLQQFMDYFQSRGVKMAVCACNTMTSYGYPVIKDKTSFALVPMNPAIIPAVKASANKHIGVIATEATIKKGMHKQAASNLDPQIKVFGVGCPKFVPLIETARSEYAEVLRMDLTAVPKLLETSEGIFRGKTVVLATGADPRTLGVAGEAELLGRGVAYCAACDGMFYKGKTVVVVGGGNSAAADALLLSRVAKKVILVHRRDTLRATKIYHEPLAQAENVEFRWNSVVSALLSGDRLTGVRLRDTVTGEESVVDCDGVFVSVGRQPATALAVGQLALDGGGYIVAGETTETSIPGVYAVGDVRTKPLRQVVTAVADGAVAVHMAEKYIAENR